MLKNSNSYISIWNNVILDLLCQSYTKDQNMINLKYLFIFLLGLPLSSFAQSQIELKNASFEGQMIKAATTPEYWSACGLYSSPDVQPGHWGVDNKPQDGSSFIGLITRDDNTWEIIAQELSEPLVANECYQFSAHLAQNVDD